jgi:hypothetical protein
MIHELEGGDESHCVEGVVFVGKVLCEAPIQCDPRWKAGSGDIQHGGRRFETGNLVAETGEPLQKKPGAAPDFEDALRQDRRPHPKENLLLDGRSRFARIGLEPILVLMGIFKAKDVPHRGWFLSQAAGMKQSSNSGGGQTSFPQASGGNPASFKGLDPRRGHVGMTNPECSSGCSIRTLHLRS